jgi:hypothetical protein
MSSRFKRSIMKAMKTKPQKGPAPVRFGVVPNAVKPTPQKPVSKPR